MVITVALAAAVQGGAASATPARENQPPSPERQLLYYNHAYGVFDRETADAIEHSAYLRKFADFQVRTTTGADGETWTGRYLMGRETYLELFGVGDVPGQDGTLGCAGTGLSTERAGDLATVIERLRAEGVSRPGPVPPDAGLRRRRPGAVVRRGPPHHPVRRLRRLGDGVHARVLRRPAQQHRAGRLPR